MPATRVQYGPASGMLIDPRLIKKRPGMPDPNDDPATSAATANLDAPTVTQRAPAPQNVLQQLQNVPTSNPVFSNEAQRNIAINTGAYDPTFSSPLQKLLANSISADRDNTQNSLIKTQQEEHPLMGAKTPQDILAAQLAADKDGTIKKIIIKNQPVPMSNDPDQIVPNDNLHPYIGSVAPNAHGDSAYAPLDFNLIHDPDFAKAYAKDPAEGARIYKAMTGRDLAIDHDTTTKLVASHQARELDTYEKNMANGSKRDSTTGTWKIRQARELDPNGNMMEGFSGAKPAEFRDATPYENQLMDRHYQQYVGPFDKKPEFTPSVTRNGMAVKARTATDPVLGKLITAKETALGRSLNPMELIHTGAEHDQNSSAQDLVSNPTNLNLFGYSPGPNVTKGLKMTQDMIANLFGGKKSAAPDAEDNGMMDIIKSHTTPALYPEAPDYSGNY